MSRYVLLTPVFSSKNVTLIFMKDDAEQWVNVKRNQLYFAHIDSKGNYTIFIEDFSTRKFSVVDKNNNNQDIESLFEITTEFKVKIDIMKMKKSIVDKTVTYKELLESMKLVNEYIEMVKGYSFTDTGVDNSIKKIYPHSLIHTLGLYEIIKI